MITVADFIKPCNCRSDDDCTHNQVAEFKALDAMVDAFAREMKKKLHAKALEGYSGWDDHECRDDIRAAMVEHATRGLFQEVDIANLAAMLWNGRQSDTPAGGRET